MKVESIMDSFVRNALKSRSLIDASENEELAVSGNSCSGASGAGSGSPASYYVGCIGEGPSPQIICLGLGALPVASFELADYRIP